uniref:CID domain-containing protein n=1 Tax=Hyaloperonospora arabidopsidis (strain Emoy2) TaxID=559515 RepID=M4BHY2_HYAAE
MVSVHCQVAPNCKLPIFYLTDSILKNVRGPYLSLFAGKIVLLYCNCVRQVSGKDLRRFIHVLNTWEATRLFSKESTVQMRSAAHRALQQADPLAHSVPASINQEKSLHVSASVDSSAKLAQQQQQDMELRSLLTKLQNDMSIHPTEHMSLEEVRTNNPEYFNQLLEFHASSTGKHTSPPRGLGAASTPPQSTKPQPPLQQATATRDFRYPASSHDARTKASLAAKAHPTFTGQAGSKRGSEGGVGAAAKSSNVAHLMQLLKRKQRAPSPPQQLAHESTNDVPCAPNAAAVIS